MESKSYHTAASAAAVVLIDAEANRRLHSRHFRMDLFSGGAGVDDSPKSTAPGAGEPLYTAYLRGQSESHVELVARGAFSNMPPRQALALLIKYLKEDRRRGGVWAATYGDILSGLGKYKTILAWKGEESFSGPPALKACANRGERYLIEWLVKRS